MARKAQDGNITGIGAKKKSGFEDTDLGNESYNFLTKTYLDYFNKHANS